MKGIESEILPIKDRAYHLPLEGNSLCNSGKHYYKNSPELIDNFIFKNMKPLAEAEFVLKTHVHTSDYSQMNFFLPERTDSKYDTYYFEKHYLHGK